MLSRDVGGSLAFAGLNTVHFEVFRSWIMAVVLGLMKFGSAMRDEIIYMLSSSFLANPRSTY